MKEQLLNLITQLRVKHCQMQKNLFDPSPEYPEMLAKISAKIDELEQEVKTEGYTTTFRNKDEICITKWHPKAPAVLDEINTMWEWLWERNYAFIKKSSLNEFDEVLGEIILSLVP